MVFRDTKLMITAGLLFCFLLLCGVGMKVFADKNKMKVTEERFRAELADTPLKAVAVTIDLSHRERFFEQLRSFSDKHAFAIRIAPTTLLDDYFIIELWREDIKAKAVNPFEVEKYRIYFYKNNIELVQEDFLNLLITELKFFLSEVPNSMVSDLKLEKPDAS